MAAGGKPRVGLGLNDQEVADARRVSTVPSVSISNSAPKPQVSITEPDGDKGEKKTTIKDFEDTD